MVQYRVILFEVPLLKGEEFLELVYVLVEKLLPIIFKFNFQIRFNVEI